MPRSSRPSFTIPSRRWCAAALLSVTLPFAWLAVPAPLASAAADGCPQPLDVDFDGDGSTDAVVADPSATVSGHAGAGRVVVLTTDGLGAIGAGPKEVLSQDNPGVADVAEDGDGFGSAISTADLDCDDRTDLVVGVPGEDVGGAADAGLVQVVWGSDAGLGHGKPSTSLDAVSFDVARHAGDRFGAAVDAVEQDGQDGTPAPDAYGLAIGVPGRDVGAATDAGAVALVVPDDGGSTRVFVTQDTPGVGGAAETGDRLGTSVTLGHLAGGSYLDAVAGAPGEDVGAEADAGAFVLLTDVTDTPTGIAVDQDSAGVPGAAEAGDRFGAVVDAVAFDGVTGYLAVAAPREDVGSAKDAGAVQVFRQQGTQLVAKASITQDTAGVAGTAEAGDRFGESLTFGAQRHDEVRLLVGVPFEDGPTAATKDAGAVQVIRATTPGDGDRSFTQDSAGVLGKAEAGDHFGSAVAVVYGNEELWLVGVPDDQANSAGMVDVIDARDAQSRAWVPGEDGIVAGGAARFGAALASGGGSL